MLPVMALSLFVWSPFSPGLNGTTQFEILSQWPRAALRRAQRARVEGGIQTLDLELPLRAYYYSNSRYHASIHLAKRSLEGLPPIAELAEKSYKLRS